MRVFISYAHADISFVHQLDAVLASNGIDAWYDRKPDVGLKGGETWERRLQDELDASAVVLVVLSPDSIRPGSFVANEYQFALNNKAQVIPLIYRECEVPLALTKFQHIDFERQLLVSAMAQLLNALKVPTVTFPAIAPNPFDDVGRIDDPTRFFNRQKDVEAVYEALRRNNCVSVTGERQMGKSSLLVFVAKQGAEKIPTARFVYLNLHTCRDDKSFYANACELLGGNGTRDRDFSQFVQNLGARVILCLDEMEMLNAKGFQGSEYIRTFLRGLAEGRDAPLKIAAASGRPLSELFAGDASPTKPSPFHALFVEQVRLANFARAQMDSFLDARLAKTGVEFDMATRDELWLMTQGHPYKLQRAAHHRYNAALDRAYDWRGGFGREGK